MKYSLTCLALALGASAACAQPVEQGAKNAPQFEPQWPTQTRAPAVDSGISFTITELATNLDVPWGIEVLPEGGYLVTERSGQLRLIRDGSVSAPISGVPEVLAAGQGGLLDVALAEDFAQSRVIYLSYAKPQPDNMSATAVARGVLSADGSTLTEVRDIFVQSPPSPTAKHYGSRVIPLDGYVYITTGEHSSLKERVYAQDKDKTYGKVVRVTPDGDAAPGNPFGTEVWTLGHRNVQGADVHPETGALWTLEHGPRGGDELNLIEPGANFGWPVVSYGIRYSGGAIGSGDAQAEGFTQPRYYWDPVIAPGGFAFYDGEMFPDWQGNVLASSLKPGGLVRLTLDGDIITGEERFLTGEMRVRDVEIDRDGAILILDGGGRVLRLTAQ